MSELQTISVLKVSEDGKSRMQIEIDYEIRDDRCIIREARDSEGEVIALNGTEENRISNEITSEYIAEQDRIRAEALGTGETYTPPPAATGSGFVGAKYVNHKAATNQKEGSDDV